MPCKLDLVVTGCLFGRLGHGLRMGLTYTAQAEGERLAQG